MTLPKGLIAGLAACLACAPAAAAQPPAAAGGSLERPPGMSERQLHTFETQVLGPEHAAEHARERKAAAAGAAAGLPPPQNPPGGPSVIGRWDQSFPAINGQGFSIPVIGVHAVMLPTGKVMWFAYPRNPSNPTTGTIDPNAPNTAQAYLWNPADGSVKRVDPPMIRDPADGKDKPANIWCGAQAMMADGRVVVVGGTLAYRTSTTSWKGLNKVFTFNPWDETWTQQPDMAHGRWYPSTVLMPDGRMVIMSGLDETGSNDPEASHNHDIEIFTPSPDLNGRGTITKLGSRSGSSGQPGGDAPEGAPYPHLFWMPSARVMVAGPERRDSWFLRAPGAGNVFQWDDMPDPGVRRIAGAGVLLPQGPAGSTKVMQIGGMDTPDNTNYTSTATTESFDEAAPANGWTPGPTMTVSRTHLNTVLLPDGSMVSVGGGLGKGDPYGSYVVSGQERNVDIFDPATGTWRKGAAQAEARAYHSTAILLPDGRVISAGDDYNGPGGPGTGTDTDTAEIYEPPYLFNPDGTLAARPSISSAPDRITWNQTFDVGTPSDVTRAALVAPGATTHANDMSQRVVPLAFQKTGGGVRLTAPPSPDVALPGYYMLFLLDSKGVPSVARWVRLAEPLSPPLPGALAPPKSSPKPAVDRRGPEIRFGGFSVRRGVLAGQALDPSGISRVEVALRARSVKSRRCRWWSRRAGRLARRGSCSRPRWIRARLRRHGSVVDWRATLHGRVPAGRYVVELRAVDGQGNVTSRSGKTAVSVSVKR